MRSFKFLTVGLLLILLLQNSCGNQSSKAYEPIIVGSPPINAFIGLVRLDNGEIRHYNFWLRNREKESYYIRSRDNGRSWDTVYVENKWIGADAKNPLTGEYIRLASDDKGVIAIRSNGGIDGNWEKEYVYKDNKGVYDTKPPVFIMGGKRILVGASNFTARNGCGVFYSDDNGLSWKRSQFVQAPPHQPSGVHKGYRWNHGAVEPTVVELQDGRIWMIVRTAQDELYESFSEDGGETWNELTPSRFYGTNTMPTIGRLHDGRLLLIWNNTTPLPEKEGADGVWEDVFTNRDALHAAISEDDGETWKGFRELILNPNRNNFNYEKADLSLSLDISVHQSQFVDLHNGEVLVSLGQHSEHRKLLIFDPNWLNETSRSDDFSKGLENWSTFLYKKGIVGHCAYNRAPGVKLVPNPEDEAYQVLKIARIDNEELEISNQGAVWNFPTLQKGRFETSIYIPEGSQGGRISLTDRWFNPSDTTAYKFAMYNLDLAELEQSKWNNLIFEWNLTSGNQSCSVKDKQGNKIATLPLNYDNVNGISYVHFISTANEEDVNGFLVERVESRAN